MSQDRMHEWNSKVHPAVSLTFHEEEKDSISGNPVSDPNLLFMCECKAAMAQGCSIIQADGSQCCILNGPRLKLTQSPYRFHCLLAPVSSPLPKAAFMDLLKYYILTFPLKKSS